jgi:hypothetical protein
VAAGLVVSLAVAAWAIDGPATASLVVLISVAVSLVLMHGLVARDDRSSPGTSDAAGLDGQDGLSDPAGRLGLEQIRLTHSFTGFWRTEGDLTSATKSLGGWDHGTRPRVANLLAARLAERHGIIMEHDPEAAKRLLLGAGSRHDLWYWVDPYRQSPPDAGSRPGIPPNVLAALIERLEQL